MKSYDLEKAKDEVCVVGLGYVGLPLAAVVARAGYNVVGFDIDPTLINELDTGQFKSNEPQLFECICSQKSKNLRFTNTACKADIYVICVPTPLDHHSETADLSFVYNAIVSISNFIQKSTLIIIESTVPIGTTNAIANYIFEELLPGMFEDPNKIHLAFSPERMLPGKAIFELSNNTRIIGATNIDAAKKAKLFYDTITERDSLIVANPRIAEASKLVENTYRDYNIAFANELSLICEELDLDVVELIDASNLHPRVNILNPGPGVGGHCIAVDPYFLISSTTKSNLIRNARDLNTQRPDWVVRKIMEVEANYDAVICYGLTYKPDINDLRESAALKIAKKLSKQIGERVMCVDPHVQGDLRDIKMITSDFLATLESDEFSYLFVILVNHSSISNFKFSDNFDILDFTYSKRK